MVITLIIMVLISTISISNTAQAIVTVKRLSVNLL